MNTKPRSARALSALLTLSLVAPACGAPEDETAGEEEFQFGLGGKADSLCEPDADLCWGTDDALTMKALERAKDDVVLGREAKLNLRTVIDLARALAHKLTAEELAAIDGLEAEIDALAEGDTEGAVMILTELQATALKRLTGTYYVAHMIPAGQMVNADITKADDNEAGVDGPSDGESIDGMTEGMKQSMQLLRDSGALGIMIAEMYKMTGVLERDYELVNAINFGEYDDVTGQIVPKGMTREAKVQHIIDKYKGAAGWVGAGSGLVGLIPIAGIPLSVSGETIALFKLHAQMSFEIASVYGWDLREGNNLFLMSMMFMTDGLIAETADVLASNVLVPILAKKVSQKLGIELSKDLAGNIAGRSITKLLTIFQKKAQQELAEQALKAGAKGVGKQLLGYATLGLTVLVSAGVDYVSTGFLGNHVATVSKTWLHDLLMEGTSYLAKPHARDCAFRGMAAIAWDDGTISDREKTLFMAFLAKPYAADESSWFFLDSGEKRRQTRMLRDWQSDDSQSRVQSCLEDTFQDTLDQHRVSLLGHLYAMMQIDLHQTPGEYALYTEYREGLDGSGWFDGEAIDEVKMDYIERAIYVVLNPNTVEVAPELTETVEDLLVEDVLPFMAEPHPETKADFDCAWAESC